VISILTTDATKQTAIYNDARWGFASQSALFEWVGCACSNSGCGQRTYLMSAYFSENY
jgi:hypothetical protein